MTLTFVVADATAREAAYHVRYRAYAGVGYVADGSGRIIDGHDAASVLFVSVVDGAVVGTIRITPPVPDLPWGISQQFPEEIAAIAEACARQQRVLWESSRVMIAPEHQKKPRLLLGLVGCLHRFGRINGIDGYVWGCTPDDSRMYERLGARRVAGPKRHTHFPTEAVALHWRLDETAPHFRRAFEGLDIRLE